MGVSAFSPCSLHARKASINTELVASILAVAVAKGMHQCTALAGWRLTPNITTTTTTLMHITHHRRLTVRPRSIPWTTATRLPMVTTVNNQAASSLPRTCTAAIMPLLPVRHQTSSTIRTIIEGLRRIGRSVGAQCTGAQRKGFCIRMSD